MLQRKVAFGYAVVLVLVASLNYLPIPGIVDDQGRTFGIFALDIYDDSLHLVSALWALAAALISTRAARSRRPNKALAGSVLGMGGLVAGTPRASYLDDFRSTESK